MTSCTFLGMNYSKENFQPITVNNIANHQEQMQRKSPMWINALGMHQSNSTPSRDMDSQSSKSLPIPYDIQEQELDQEMQVAEWEMECKTVQMLALMRGVSPDEAWRMSELDNGCAQAEYEEVEYYDADLPVDNGDYLIGDAFDVEEEQESEEASETDADVDIFGFEMD